MSKNSSNQRIECLTIWLNSRKFNEGKKPKIKVYDKYKSKYTKI